MRIPKLNRQTKSHRSLNRELRIMFYAKISLSTVSEDMLFME
jgi:hypothetical protein